MSDITVSTGQGVATSALLTPAKQRTPDPIDGWMGGLVMAERKGISKTVRFEVFKRDGFKCQYCGAAAPEAILEVDHIHPVSKGGENDLMNLITACKPCNAGKSDKTLSDDSALQKQRAMLEELNERREQLEMLLAWREGLKDIDDEAVTAATSAWQAHTPGYSLNETGKKSMKALVKKFGLNAVLDAIEVSALQYLRTQPLQPEAVEAAWQKIGGICRVKAMPQWQQELRYVRGILRNRLSYMNNQVAMDLLEHAHLDRGVDIDDLKDLARRVSSWTDFKNQLADMTGE